MTLDKWINELDEQVIALRRQASYGLGNPDPFAWSPDECIQAAEEKEQMSNWLKDYKRLREMSIKCDDCFYKKEFENRINNGEHI